MDRIWMKSWQADLPRELTFERGVKPIHEYLKMRAEETPDKTAVIFYGRKISYRELDDSTDRFAAYLAAQGVVKGDRVGIFMGNCPQYIIAHFGAQKIGAAVCPCSPLFKEMELEHELNDAGIKVLVSWDILLPVALGAVPRTGVKKVVAANLADYLPSEPELPILDIMRIPKKPIEGVDDFMKILEDHQPNPPRVEIDLFNDIGLFQYTGGTTGLPKGCMLTYHAALFKTAAVCAITKMNKDTVSLVTMPVFHIAGMLAGMNSCILAGATQVLITRFEVPCTVMAIEKYKVDFWYSAVPMNVGVMNTPQAQGHDLTSLKLCLTSSFGIQLTEEISRRWEEFSGGGLLLEGAYGLSETHTADTYMPRDKIKYGTVGIPGFETDFKIVDLDDRTREMPVGAPGEIVVKNPGVFKGYWNKPAETEVTLVDGWVYTGDIGRFDEDGFLYLLGRRKEMIKVSGFSVFPEEVELLLNRFPGVAQSAVIGVPDPRKGEVVKAYIVLAPGCAVTAEDIQKWAKENMSSYKYPAHIEFRDSLPTLGTGKLLRRALKD
ncbi:MAG: AMP-binding protein [Pseudomonadota bacterium]